jgi:phosphotransferase system  glucose/maltose/N-acetylglucosamine-specific IIC component
MLEGKIIVALATGLVAVILLAGLYSLYRGGDFARSYSNKIMRLRIVAQFVAIVVIMIVLYVWGRG